MYSISQPTPASVMYLLSIVARRDSKMPQGMGYDDQAPRGEALVETQKAKRETIPLTERSVRMRQAECIAKGGSDFQNGVCFK